jgi:hypothetical protein
VAPKKSRWLPGLRALLLIGRELRLIRLGVERLADLQDGRQISAIPLPDAPEEPLSIAQASDLDFARGYEVEQRLARQLGRQPTPEEICQEIDGIEWDPIQPMVVVGRRQPERDPRLH